MRPGIAELVDIAARAAVAAGEPLAGRFRAGADADRKPGVHAHDLVTRADAETESAVRSMLTAACPGSVVVGEEAGRGGGDGGRDGDAGGDGGSRAPGAPEVRWIVDPIDGTNNFVRGVPLFCVSIGVRLADGTAGGCVYDPVHGELFTATPGGLRLNGGPPPPVRGPADVPLVLTDVPRPGVPPDPGELELFASLVEAADVRRIGSCALALAYVACGRADVAAVADAFVWDTAAGTALVAAAGGGFAAAPEPRADRPGGITAWAPGSAALGRRVAAALGAGEGTDG